MGDDTAWRLGGVSFNPMKPIDPLGTILLPAFLLALHSPFLFGYAKPVPVNFRALRNPRRDMVWVAVAGPAANILMATAAALMIHLAGLLPGTAGLWFLQKRNNVTEGVFQQQEPRQERAREQKPNWPERPEDNRPA